MSDDLEGSQEAFGELPRGAGRANVLCLDEGEVTDGVVRRGGPVTVRLRLVALLSDADVFAEYRVKLIKVDCEFASASGGDVAFGVNRQFRVVTLVGEERGDSGRRVGSVVVGELGERKEVRPVVLLVVAVDPDVLLEGLIRAFGLSVAFRMVSGSEVKADAEEFSERLEEVIDEFDAAVRCNVRGDSVLGEDVNKE